MRKALQNLVVIALLFTSIGAFAQKDSLHYTGSVQKIIVPGCADSIIVDVIGAQGGGAFATMDSNNGGLGGRVQATLPVHGGDSLLVYVGGMGGYADTIPGRHDTTSAGVGGFNGGDTGAVYALQTGYAGGGGGGASDIRLNGRTLADRIVVAGGGGGGGFDNCFYCEHGGDGGGLKGDSGSHIGSTVAGGGTQLAGGPGAHYPPYGAGDTGVLGMGGLAGSSSSGGGGGGGYYGGGGGSLGGGGGGSGYTEPTAVSIKQTTGYRAGNGYVLITFKLYTITTAVDSSLKWACFSSLWAKPPTGGVAPYSYSWTGTGTASTDTISNACAGTYTLHVTDKYGCKDSTKISLVLDGIEQLSNNNDLKVYPIPTKGLLNIDMPNGNTGITSLYVFDVTGRQIMSERINNGNAHLSLDLSSLESGIYFLRMSGNDSSQKYIRFEIVK